MASTEETATTEALDIAGVIPTDLDQVGQLWAQVQDIVAVWGLKVIAAIVALNAVIGIWQEGKALAAVAALRRLASTHAVIVRDGVAVPRPTAELVIGDVITVAEGDAIGADCRLIEVASLEVAEAPITGESAPVGKTIGVAPDAVLPIFSPVAPVNAPAA